MLVQQAKGLHSNPGLCYSICLRSSSSCPKVAIELGNMRLHGSLLNSRVSFKWVKVTFLYYGGL
jgi:hypothetical protein